MFKEFYDSNGWISPELHLEEEKLRLDAFKQDMFKAFKIEQHPLIKEYLDFAIGTKEFHDNNVRYLPASWIPSWVENNPTDKTIELFEKILSWAKENKVVRPFSKSDFDNMTLSDAFFDAIDIFHELAGEKTISVELAQEQIEKILSKEYSTNVEIAEEKSLVPIILPNGRTVYESYTDNKKFLDEVVEEEKISCWQMIESNVLDGAPRENLSG